MPSFAPPAGPPYPAGPDAPGTGSGGARRARRGNRAHPRWSRRNQVPSPSLGQPPMRRRTAVFYILIFGLLAVVLVVAFAKKWSSRNKWPEDE